MKPTPPRSSAAALQLPPDYYQRIFDVEESHWWHQGMREVTRALLRDRLERRGQRLLDAGCGTGGFLRWALDRGLAAEAAGVDLSETAIELAQRRVDEAVLRVAPVRQLPFPDGAFDLAVLNDVLQHVPEADVRPSLRELRRVLRAGGALLVRTNGARRARRERPDWRAYDRAALTATLEDAGFSPERVTYANMLLSLWAAARRCPPRAPTESRDGIPAAAGHVQQAIGLRLLRAEARYLAHRSGQLPYGHTLFAVAVPVPGAPP